MGGLGVLKLLPDTHIFLWSLLEPTRLSKRVAAELENPLNELWLSPIVIWEVLILAERRRVSLEPRRKTVGGEPVVGTLNLHIPASRERRHASKVWAHAEPLVVLDVPHTRVPRYVTRGDRFHVVVGRVVCDN